MRLHKGKVVTIYEDPVSETVPEGEAKLLRKVRVDGDYELWVVHFVEDHPSMEVERKIKNHYWDDKCGGKVVATSKPYGRSAFSDAPIVDYKCEKCSDEFSSNSIETRCHREK